MTLESMVWTWPEELQPSVMHAERAPALEKEMAQLAAEQQRCRQEGKRVLQAIGGEAPRSDLTTKRLAELDVRDHQLEQRMAELHDELAGFQSATASAAEIQRAVALSILSGTC
jgi:hypothetical protein